MSAAPKLFLPAMLGIAAAIFSITGGAASAATVYVDADSIGIQDGLSWGTAFTDLQDALALAAGDPVTYTEIWVASGTYTPDDPGGDRSAAFNAVDGVAVYGGFSGIETELGQRDPDANPTLLSGDLDGDDGVGGTNDNSYHVIISDGASTAAVFDGFIITGGVAGALAYPANSGPGVHVVNGGLTLVDCDVTANMISNGGTPAGMYEGGGYGGGIYVSGSTLNLTDCRITSNATGRSAAIISTLGGQGGHGGGLACVTATVNLDGCFFDGNFTADGSDETIDTPPGSGGFGGAIYSEDSTVSLLQTEIEDNYTGDGGDDTLWLISPTGGLGGAIFAADSDLSFDQVRVEGNWTGNGLIGGSGGHGAGIFFTGGTHTVERSFILLNSAGSGVTAGLGGGVAIDVLTDIEFINSIIVQNAAGGGAGSAGGGIYTAVPISLTFCTVADNTVAVGGSGSAIANTALVTALNTIIWNNTVSGAIDANYCDVEGGVAGGTGNLDTDPLFRPGATNYRLLPHSPLIDMGADVTGVAIDFDGNARGYDGDGETGTGDGSENDIGAVEATYPRISVVAVDDTAAEPNSDNGLLRIVREGEMAGTVSVLGYWHGTATKGPDYAALALPQQLAPAENQRDMPVNVKDDAVLEGAEVATLTLFTSFNYRLLDDNEASVTIGDNEDKPVLDVSVPDNQASEPGRNTATFRVTRSGDTTDPMTFYFAWTGTAAKGSDFRAWAHPVDIPAGSATVDLIATPMDDLTLEGDETIALALIPRPGYQVGTATGDATLLDNDNMPAVSVQALNGGYEPTGALGRFLITRAGELTVPLDVYVSWTGEAVKSQDYKANASPITIPIGQSSLLVPVYPLNDSELEGDETVILNLLPGEDYTVGDPGSATIIIDDDEDNPTVTVEVIDGVADESGDNPGLLRLTRTGDTTDGLNVEFYWKGTAQKGPDFVSLAGPVTIPAGQASLDIPVGPKADAAVEGIETATLEIIPAFGYNVGDPGEGTVAITDTP